MATDLEAVAKWHEERMHAAALIGDAEWAIFHTEAAAAIRAALIALALFLGMMAGVAAALLHDETRCERGAEDGR
jgi:hypothetical protein